MKTFAICTLVAIVAIAAGAALADTGDALSSDVPAGTYRIDPTHASLLFRVDHMGFSKYTARFTGFEATLEFDPQNPAASALTATVDATTLETDFPFPEQVDFDAQLQGKDWLNTAEHPRMTYRSTGVELTGTNTARIEGELTLRGVTRPMALDATFNGGYPGMSMDGCR